MRGLLGPQQQFQGRVTEVIRTEDGTALHRVRYRMPEPTFQMQSCGIPVFVDSDLVVAAAFVRCVESQAVAVWMHYLGGFDLPSTCVSDQTHGMNWQGEGGARIEELLHDFHAQGLFYVFLRAIEIETTADADKFVRAWDTRRDELKRLSAELDGSPTGDNDETRALVRQLREVGLRLVPRKEDTQHPGVLHVRSLINRSSGYG